jgi:hypothetical protein
MRTANWLLKVNTTKNKRIVAIQSKLTLDEGKKP